ncbi:hypothetical protein KSP40_PGU010335 [Platanthera guangdongensis]|uniref:Glutamyl/glutaminyl-tRNA synthetase class Ib catalytic domain-containing protein n=1 Tax=Platanthera guangdongensis TaxID=2320717 RepID=A0ABR2LN58_9ASPA
MMEDIAFSQISGKLIRLQRGDNSCDLSRVFFKAKFSAAGMSASVEKCIRDVLPNEQNAEAIQQFGQKSSAVPVLHSTKTEPDQEENACVTAADIYMSTPLGAKKLLLLSIKFNVRSVLAYSSSAYLVLPFSYIYCVRYLARFNLSFKALVTTNETDDSEASNTHQGREPAINWGSTNSPYLSSGLDDPNSSYPYLPPVLEEPSSSFSEAADDDPVPAIEGLQISGDAFPGRELQACGYSINGTTSCNFEMPPVYTGKWSTASDGEIHEELDKMTPHTYRFRVAKEGTLKINDLVRGEGLGFTMPSFAHVSLILAPDRSKLSKRHGATSVGQFREIGYLPKSMVNYLALLGWSDGTGNEFFTMDQLILATFIKCGSKHFENIAIGPFLNDGREDK